jgi:hypothetical protein
MIRVELQECEAFAKLAEYESSLFLKNSEDTVQAINKLKVSIIQEIGDINYYEAVNSEEYCALLGVIKGRLTFTKEGKEFRRRHLVDFYNREYKCKLRLQKRWFNRSSWAVRVV